MTNLASTREDDGVIKAVPLRNNLYAFILLCRVQVICGLALQVGKKWKGSGDRFGRGYS